MPKPQPIVVGPNPFTPRSGQEPKAFLGREEEVRVFLKHLSHAQNERYEHFVVIGGWGVGKTTLLKEYRKVAQTRKVITAFLSVHEFPTDDLLPPVVHLLTQVPRTLPIRFDRLKRFAKHLEGIGITLPVIGGGINLSQKNRFEGDPQVLLLEGLTSLWKELKEELDVLVVFLDDVQNYGGVPHFLGVLKNVLSDDEIANGTGYLFVLSSTETGWSGFLKKNHPIGRFFVPIQHIHSFSKADTLRIVEVTLKDSRVEFDDLIKEAIYEYTEGHPFQMQIFSSYLYDNQLNGKVGPAQLDAALNQTLDGLGPILLDSLYESASDQEKTILQAMSKYYRDHSFEKLLSELKENETPLSKGVLASALSRLIEKGLLTKVARGKYKVVNRLLNEFLTRK